MDGPAGGIRLPMKVKMKWFRVGGVCSSLLLFLFNSSSARCETRELIQNLREFPPALAPSEKLAADTYLILRKDPTSDAYQEKKRFCEKGESDDLFCPLYAGQNPEVEDWGPYAEEESPKSAEVLEEVGVSGFVSALRNQEIDVLQTASSKRIYRGLKLITSQDSLHSLTIKLLDLSQRELCKNTALVTALGQKHETFFPGQSRVSDAINLYSRVEKCGRDEFSVRARFRLALLLFEGKEYIKSIGYFERVYAEKQAEYAARGLYWLSVVHQKIGFNFKADLFKQKLLKEHPMSYHTVALFQKEPKFLARVMVESNPEVRARSERYSTLNAWIRMVEVLSVRPDAHVPARRILNRLIEVSQGLEPSVKLYLAALATKLDDSIARFKILGMAFKEAPENISWTTLKLFYPMKNRLFLDRESVHIDPLFLASLIRQESGFNSDARSRVGALGLMQLMPSTARSVERVSKPALLRPDVNIRIGRKYFSHLLNRLDSDAELALAAYNAGIDRVEEWKKRYEGYSRMGLLDLIPFKETRDYVVLISRNYYWYRHLYDTGIVSPKRTLAQVQTKHRLKLFTLSEN